MAPKKPAKLAPEVLTDAHWSDIEARWRLDPRYKMLIAVGREAWATWVELRGLVDAQGITVKGRYGQRVNPLLGALARARESLVKILAQIDLGEDGA